MKSGFSDVMRRRCGVPAGCKGGSISVNIQMMSIVLSDDGLDEKKCQETIFSTQKKYTHALRIENILLSSTNTMLGVREVLRSG